VRQTYHDPVVLLDETHTRKEHVMQVRKQMVSVSVTPRNLARIDALSEKNEVSRAEIVRRAIEMYLDSESAESPALAGV
jgi:hypothetical protein